MRLGYEIVVTKEGISSKESSRECEREKDKEKRARIKGGQVEQDSGDG